MGDGLSVEAISSAIAGMAMRMPHTATISNGKLGRAHDISISIDEQKALASRFWAST
jgi:hypothetical protein